MRNSWPVPGRRRARGRLPTAAPAAGRRPGRPQAGAARPGLMADEDPSDNLIARLYREMDKRALTVFSMWKVTTKAHQQRCRQKRSKLAGGLVYEHQEGEDEPLVECLDVYLEKSNTYCIALATAGVGYIEGQQNASQALGVDLTTIVQVPWEVTMRYHTRIAGIDALPPGGHDVVAFLYETEQSGTLFGHVADRGTCPKCQ